METWFSGAAGTAQNTVDFTTDVSLDLVDNIVFGPSEIHIL